MMRVTIVWILWSLCDIAVSFKAGYLNPALVLVLGLQLALSVLDTDESRKTLVALLQVVQSGVQLWIAVTTDGPLSDWRCNAPMTVEHWLTDDRNSTEMGNLLSSIGSICRVLQRPAWWVRFTWRSYSLYSYTRFWYMVDPYIRGDVEEGEGDERG